MNLRPEDMQPVLSAREVAERYYVDATTVKRWARSGMLPGFRTLGGWWRFRESDVEALMTQTWGPR